MSQRKSRNNVKENKMGVAPVGKLLVTMAVPLMLSMLMQACYNIVDSIFVAMLSEDALTAVSMAFPIQTVMIAVCTGIGVGMNAMLSKSLGEKDPENASRAANNGVFLALCSYVAAIFVGLLLVRPFYMSQISYNLDIVNYGVSYTRIVCLLSIGMFCQMTFERMMQGTGHTIYTMFTQISGAIINLILDPILIFGLFGAPKMGVAGAALATCIGQWFAGVLAIVLNHFFNTELSVSLRQIFHPSAGVIRRIAYVGVPSFIMASIGSVMYYGMNLILTGFNSTASAVFGVYFKLQSFFFLPIFGMNSAIVPIVAYNYGAGKRSRMLQTLKTGLILALCIMILGTIVFETVPGTLLDFFSASENMKAIGVPALRIIAIHFPLAAVGIVLGTMFQSLGQAIFSAIISLCRQLIVLLPCAFVLAKVGGLGSIWFCFPIAETVSLVLTLVFFTKVYREVVLQVPDKA